jgi:putative Holliday junction resolvase
VSAKAGLVSLESEPELRRSPFQHRNLFSGYFDRTYNANVPSEPTESQNGLGSRLARVLGLDVGSKRIGLAISDPLGITAQGLETLHRQNKRLDFAQLEKVVREYRVVEIVVGYPLRMSGAEGIQAEKMQRFAEELRQRFPIPVHLWDERLSSAQANRLLRETEMSIKRRGQVVDQMAAVLILQSWMDARDNRLQEPGI